MTYRGCWLTAGCSRVLLGTFMLALSACATAGPNPVQTRERIVGLEEAVRQAHGGQRPKDAEAARFLGLAREELAVAKQRAATGDTARAARLLARSEADLQLSELLAREAQAEANARTYEQQLRETRGVPAQQAR